MRFCRLIFKNHDLFNFARSFHAMPPLQSLLLFCASIDLSFNFKFSDVFSWMCSKLRTILVKLKNIFCILESSILLLLFEGKLNLFCRDSPRILSL